MKVIILRLNIKSNRYWILNRTSKIQMSTISNANRLEKIIFIAYSWIDSSSSFLVYRAKCLFIIITHEIIVHCAIIIILWLFISAEFLGMDNNYNYLTCSLSKCEQCLAGRLSLFCKNCSFSCWMCKYVTYVRTLMSHVSTNVCIIHIYFTIYIYDALKQRRSYKHKIKWRRKKTHALCKQIGLARFSKAQIEVVGL